MSAFVMESHPAIMPEILGLGRLKQQISRCVVSCKIRHAPFPHSLISGLGGTGKTTIARSIAKMLGYAFFDTEAAELKTRDTALNWLVDCNDKALALPFVIFIDECHRLGDRQESFYYPMVDRFANRGGKRIRLNSFTLIGATTRRDMLDQGSFITRFQNVWDIGRYSLSDMEMIVRRECGKQGLASEPAERSAISRRCLGIPRRAVGLVEKVRDQVLYAHSGDLLIRSSDVEDVFRLEEIDCIGLEKAHVQYLRALADTRGHPKGLGMLAAILGRAKTVVEDTIEPILISLGFVATTSKGRLITDRGHNHLVKQGLAG